MKLELPDERGTRPGVELGERSILTASPGTLLRLLSHRGVSGFVAHCSIGKGKATVVADADFLNIDRLDGATNANLDGLLAELEALER